MDVIEDNMLKTFKWNTYIALGSFDGLHLGHSKLINKAIELAKKNSGKSMVYTFKNHPLSIINKDLVPKLLMDIDQKKKVLNKMGLDYLNLVNFDEEFMKMSPEEFIYNIVSKFNAKGIVVGFNYRFGYKNLGDVDLLKKLSEKYKFQLHVVKPVKYKKELVSSSHIRHIITDTGDMVKAKMMLTRPYSISGTVIVGKQLGRVLGFPTINLSYDKGYITPRGGVYFTLVEYEGKFYKGVTNVGYNPTVEDGKLGIETHIIGFNKEIYSEDIRLHFIHRIRDEKKFNSLEELAHRIGEDKKYVIKQNLELIIKSNLQL
ncbi:bifunctional riboflavin kinase/FAD synthetase [Clostridium sp. MSJ-11]|uniref:Riboflavin biosynthesis protein n=1 Tax=Clostridium mobile TaxID=2841512 RepID=A0ABS6EC83_9CLOT|nr:bifunctional riboflavin kinase/FAD synthetase [Clostridium mobile]MBU5482790.1 bifunctional riboflavin kinase/FAD synthetase [Clostridium mobile]